MNQQTIQKLNESSTSTFFPEHDDENDIYKNCINYGQGQYPHKHGMCHICGVNNWITSFEKKKQPDLKLNSFFAGPDSSLETWKKL